MLVPLKWLNEYVKVDDIKPQEFSDRMTMSGSKVEEVIETGKEIKNVVTGKIIKLEKHPDADKLLICQIDTGNQVVQIVTGADNVREGQVVPAALHGALLPGGKKIKRGKFRGVESNGMLCSAVELGIGADADGILILPQDTPVGIDVRDAVGKNSVIVDFEITPNRPDCLSMVGMAREAAATFDRKLCIPEISFNENNEDVKDYIDVEIKDKDLCPRYAARVIKNVKVCDSPGWLKERLTEAGMRPVNNIVDITNYVMLEYGQPLHAFDYEKINGKKIIVRRAQDGEKLKTLDGKDRDLSSSMLVIADYKKPLVVAGVMGGAYSEIENSTSTIMLESANFNAVSVRRTSKKLGLRTESSSRYEKGLDPNIAITAINRAAQLIADLAGGEIVSGIVDRYENKLQPWTIDISPERINRFLGTNIAADEMASILRKLDIQVESGDVMKAIIPTFRADLEQEVDIAEEIARIFGYDNIKPTMIRGESLQGGRNREQKIQDIVKEILVGAGLYEITTYSLGSTEDFDRMRFEDDSSKRKCIRIQNPIGEDLSIMRTSMIPSMLSVIKRNYNKKNEEAGLFETGRVYLPLYDEESKLPLEKNKLIIGMYGGYDFYDVKGIVELLLSNLGIKKYEIEREQLDPSFHPGKTAKLFIRRKEAGIMGEIHPDVLENYDIPIAVYICELDFDMLIEEADQIKHFKQLPKYPSVDRDIALLVDKNIPVSEIEDIARKQGKGLIESIKLFDVYEGEQIPEGKKSVAYSIKYRAEDHTLKDEEVNKVHDSIIKAFEAKLNAQLRL